MDCLFNQKKKSIIQENYDEFSNNYSRSYISDSGKEIRAYDIPKYNIHSAIVVRLSKDWESVSPLGLVIKGKVDFDKLYGFDWNYLRILEKEGFIKIKQLSKNHHNISIKWQGKNFKFVRGLE
jgi:hypothetical protein